ncbi:MAG: hypothetical protein CVV44_16225 [Spirochaetae bacterium HGW-Spirochaetae-1]|jgi:magnesium-transporting ATPase (P-type)|nr:MAG: hypothetical protein CVV44_16225 [Spirochaetae bacterium HGW-Spirochaetae-1]
MIKKSTILFWILSVICFLFGIVYVIKPIASYHEKIIGMTASALAANYATLSGLIVTLVDVLGVTFFTIGIFGIYSGFLAWKNKASWITMFVVLFTFYLPMTYIVYCGGGPYKIPLATTVLQSIALILSGTLEREW